MPVMAGQARTAKTAPQGGKNMLYQGSDSPHPPQVAGNGVHDE